MFVIKRLRTRNWVLEEEVGVCASVGHCPQSPLNLRTSERFWNISETMGHFFSLTAIWLPHGQFRAIIQGTASLTDVNHCILNSGPEGYRQP